MVNISYGIVFTPEIRHSVVQILDLDIRDYESLSQAYSPEASELLKQHDARQVVSVDVLKSGKKVKGQWDPGYLIVNTWESEDCFNQAYYGGQWNLYFNVLVYID